MKECIELSLNFSLIIFASLCLSWDYIMNHYKRKEMSSWVDRYADFYIWRWLQVFEAKIESGLYVLIWRGTFKVQMKNGSWMTCIFQWKQLQFIFLIRY